MDRHDTLLLACGTSENRKILRGLLSERFNLLEAVNTRQTALLLQQNIHCIAAVILDVTNPEVIDAEQLQRPPAVSYLETLPIIVITRKDSPEEINLAFSYGASDVIPLDYDLMAMLHRIENIVDLHLHKQQLEVLVNEQADVLRHSNDHIVDVLSSIIEYRSVESGQHILRIRHFTRLLLEEIARCCPEYGLTDSSIGIISSASALHDVGKIAIPDAILMKPGKLTDGEMQVMKTHVQTGCHILQRMDQLVNQEYLRYAHNICHYHHERWDGGGYPEGLSGEDIPICAQVVGLADVYDALTTKRVYKEAYPFDTAVNMILKGECGAFSPKLLECFKHITGEYEALAMAYADGLAPESEHFDAELPRALEARKNDSMERTWAKYQALVHYTNVFLMELDMDAGLFHLIYNPYPEFASFQDANNFSEIAQLLLDQLVVPEERQAMEHFLDREIAAFIDEGLRRVSYVFHLRSKTENQAEAFDVTLLRVNPADSDRRTLAVLGCKRSRKADTLCQLPGDRAMLEECTFCCRYDDRFTLQKLGSSVFEIAGFRESVIRQRFAGSFLEMVPPEDRDALHRAFREQLHSGRQVQLEHKLRHKSGRNIWVLHKSRLEIGLDGQEYLYSTLTDISASKRAMEVLEKKLRRYEIILAQTENVLFEWDVTTDYISFSDTWKKIFGFSPLSSNVRKALMQGAYFHPDDLPLLFDGIANLEQGSAYEMVEVRIATDKGRYLWCRFRATAIRDEAGALKRIAGIIINIDAEKQAAQALQARAERDSLTKLLNKNTARKRAEEYFRQFSKNLNCALLIIDLDDFKQVNDRYGHLFGDAVLTTAAKEIRKLFRNQDIIARIGGDEFMVVMRGVSDRALVENRCAQLIEVLQYAFQSYQKKLPIRCSVGVALGPDHGRSYFELFEHADQALYQAKKAGKNSFRFYDPHMQPWNAQAQLTAISHHIDSDEQPGMADGNIVHYAFQRLYTANDVGSAIDTILDMIGRQMNVSRVYIFENSPDNRYCSNTYEWCNVGIRPEKENLQDISYETDIPGYEDNFNEEGIFYCPDIGVLPQEAYDIVNAQGIKSMLQCAIRENGVFRGYIGFDECVQQRYWTKEQINLLTYFSEMLSVFLLKQQAQKRTAQRVSDLSSILDNQNAWIYIIDPDTCELKYVNAKTKHLAPDVAPGMCCYSSLLGREERCADCPARNIRQTKTCSAVLHNQRFDLDVHAEATLIQWEGQESCLLTCRQLRETDDLC